MTFEKLNNLNGQIAVVTGANGGMGRAICQRLAELGATLYGISRSRVDELQLFLDGIGSGHRAILGDVTNGVRLQEIAATIPRCDLLITAAGESKIIPHDNLVMLSPEEFTRLINDNLTSVYLTVRAFVPALKNSTSALVVNISSASSLRGGGSNLAYAAAKAGVDSLTKNLSMAFAPTIRFIALNPSAVDTGFVPFLPERLKNIANFTPLKRLTTVDDIANAVEAFATTLRFTTGNCFAIDGGKII